MNNLDSIKNIIKKHKDELQNEYSVEKIGLFGSYVKGLERSDSDLDILIEFSKPVGMIKFMRLEDYLTRLTGIKVDLVSRNALKKHIGKVILGETIYV